MSIHALVFSGIPLVALLSNLFLFLTLLSARKTQMIYSFMVLLAAFILWTSGSLFMRMELYPGVNFWWSVSIVGVASVPLSFYLFMFHFTNQKGYVIKNIWVAVSLVMIVLAGLGVFVGNPVVTVVNGEKDFAFHTYWPAVIALIYAVLILLSIVPMVRNSLTKSGTPASQFTPLLVGMGCICAGSLVNMLSVLGCPPTDTLGCALNAVCMYYALYRKRLLNLTQLTSRGPNFLISAIFSAGFIFPLFEPVNHFLANEIPQLQRYQTLVSAVLFSLAVLLIFTLINRLTKKLFIEKKEQQELLVKDFSLAVNRTLNLSEVMNIYCDLLRGSLPGENACICLYNAETESYDMAYCMDPLARQSFSIPRTHPLVGWLEEKEMGVRYADFQRTSTYRSMWESEKKLLSDLHVVLILPISNDGQLVGFTLFPDRYGGKSYTPSTISYLESVASVLSIAVKNASLYDKLNREARMDVLTGLYNRRSFMTLLKEDFAKVKGEMLSVILFNLDDFKLYNELYGSEGGDDMLRSFAALLQGVFPQPCTVARYGGKEFAAILPFSDADSALRSAGRVRDSLQSQLSLGGEGVRRFLTFSAGVCTYPTSAANPEELVSYANMAVDAAKRQGKNRIVAYSRNTELEKSSSAMQSKLDIGQEYLHTILALTAAIDAKDHYTFSHSGNVSSLATQLAQAYGLDAEHCEIIRQAGLLHDIGKIGIPDAILSKPARLTEEEYGIMKEHVERSISMIRHLPSLDYVIPVVLGHHERYDGKGYPRGLRGDAIPIGARCMAIADSFDAMVSRRSYKDPMPVDRALDEILRNLGTQFDPELGKLFVEQVSAGKIRIENISEPAL